MIDKTSLQESQKIDHTQPKEPLLTLLQTHFPQTIKEGKPDLSAIATLLGINKRANHQGYELTFTGKGLANALYSLPTALELKHCPKLSLNPKNSTSSNTLIIGDNLDALKLLKSAYSESIKMIYIDPPYNTKNEDFIYPDNFREDYQEILRGVGLLEISEDGVERESETLKFFRNITGSRSHSGWLAFMLPRLKLARDLLKDDGVIFISIDDNEQANLKLLCDEIFGEGNFVGDFIRKTKSTTNDAKTGVNYQHEFLLCYAKNKENVNLLGGQKDLDKYKNPDNDPNGEWVLSDPSAKSGTMENGYFAVKNPYTGKVDYPPEGRFWLFSQNTIQKHIDEGRICFKKEHNENERGFIYKRYLKDLKTTLTTFDSLKFTQNEFMNQNATKELLELGIGEYFTYPKGVNFMREIINHATNKEDTDIILDFFAGSGTTAQAVMEQNIADGGNRQFILVQLDEPICEKKSKTAYDFLKNELKSARPVISDITIERIRRASQKLSETSKSSLFEGVGDMGFEVYAMTPKPHLIQSGEHQLALFSQRQGLSKKDIARNLALGTGKPLSAPLDEICKDKLYFCDGAYYLLGVDTLVWEHLESIKQMIYIDGYGDIDLQDFLNLHAMGSGGVQVVY
ncbi:site-specific DNA-methyltransferase [Helicobacter sp. 12S02634-8]|uniref:site-specific DNA-methyltransferase n=1 Tax=Helicobacter sp. 12S02634-8 TaxID=1476199 RepID=UPI000BA7ACE7|nr:site-specific DNA-methyltransferase [Helicobacter sp. 12S02634-8]PAF46522.1 site-specific DNA-methyltransferase [Helicobacter sp. 12S02634-8]